MRLGNFLCMCMCVRSSMCVCVCVLKAVSHPFWDLVLATVSMSIEGGESPSVRSRGRRWR